MKIVLHPFYKKMALALFSAGVSYLFLVLWLIPLHAILISTILFLVIIWTNEALPLGVVSLLPLLLFPSFGVMDLNSVAPNYSKSIIFLFLGGFFLAIAVEKTKLHITVVNKLLKMFPLSIGGLMYALFITSALMSSLLSNTTTTLLLVPVVLALSEVTQLRVRFLLSIAYGASVGGVLTPIGTAPNMLLLGFVESHELLHFNFIEWVGAMFPLVVLMMITLPYILTLGVEKKHLHSINEHKTHFDFAQKKVAAIISIMAAILFLNAPIEPYYSGLGLNEKMILLGFGLLMFVPQFGVLEWSDSKKVPYEIIFLFGAGFSIAAAMQSTGLADLVANLLNSFASLPLVVLLALTSMLVIFSTEITSNTALTSVMLPIIFAFGMSNNLDTNLLLLVATVSASFAFMLPIATPPNAIVMSSGAIKITDMMKFGLLFNIIGVIFIVIIALIFW
jgi:solute carrier family 13 (sodium-dependent dicarboxylate transporter), member 2/3/5